MTLGVPDLKFGIRADNQTDPAFAAARRNLNQVEAGLAGVRREAVLVQSAGGLISGLMRGLAAGAVIGGMRQAVGAVADLAVEARRFGMTAEDLQRWQYAAEQTRIPIDTLTGALRELQLRGDEFATTGGGPAAEAFARLGLNVADVTERLSKPAALFDEITDRLHGLDRAAQIRITDELFGGSAGERFLQVLSLAPDELRRLREGADAAGRLISEDMVGEAAELDRQFRSVTGWVNTQLKSAVVGVAGVIADMATSLANLGGPQTMEQAARFLGHSVPSSRTWFKPKCRGCSAIVAEWVR